MQSYATNMLRTPYTQGLSSSDNSKKVCPFSERIMRTGKISNIHDTQEEALIFKTQNYAMKFPIHVFLPIAA